MDGVIRARTYDASTGKDPIGTAIPLTNPLFDPAKPPIGVYHAPSLIDGVVRIASYRRLKSYPLVVRVAIAEDEAYTALRWHRTSLLFLGTLGTAGLVLVHWLTFRLATRQQLFRKELEAINSLLQLRIDQSVAELRQKDQLMITQGRQAAMGEMIGNIAHQWRQPLNALAMVLGNITSAFQYNELTATYLDEAVENGNRLIQKMSTTINDFRNFFRPEKEKRAFPAREQINQAILLVGASVTSQNIILRVDAPNELILIGFPNEYSQVLLNLIANARDAIKESGALHGTITISLFECDGRGCTSVSDNGGGIPAGILDKIYEPYFSTKQMGTGIGLYMSKMIVERSMDGTIEAHNIEGGTEFVISTPLEGSIS